MIKRPEEERMQRPEEVELDRDVSDERTRRLPRLSDEEADAIVNVNQPPSRTYVHHDVPASVLVSHKAQQAVWYFFGVVETLLALRFILLAVGANPANLFFAFVRDLTNPLVAPFANIVQTPQLGPSILELGTIFAMIIYLLLAIALAKLLELLLTRGDAY